MVRKFVAVLFALALIGASVSAAQIGIGLSGQYLSLGGDDFSGTDAGFGVEGNVLFPVGQSIKLGASGQWSTHDAGGDNVSLIGALAEGRYMFGGGAKMTPYIGARGGWTQASSDVTGLGSVKASGFAFGGGVGVMIAMSPTLAIDLNGMFHTVSLGDASLDGTTQPGTESSGTALQIRAGINFTLGGGQ
jgi:opacity protein-like surface antigen